MSFEDVVHRTSGYAIASLVLGIAGVTFFPLVPSILAVVFGGKARAEIRSGARGDGLATAGIVLGWIGIGLAVLAFAVFLLLLLLWAS